MATIPGSGENLPITLQSTAVLEPSTPTPEPPTQQLEPSIEQIYLESGFPAELVREVFHPKPEPAQDASESEPEPQYQAPGVPSSGVAGGDRADWALQEDGWVPVHQAGSGRQNGAVHNGLYSQDDPTLGSKREPGYNDATKAAPRYPDYGLPAPDAPTWSNDYMPPYQYPELIPINPGPSVRENQDAHRAYAPIAEDATLNPLNSRQEVRIELAPAPQKPVVIEEVAVGALLKDLQDTSLGREEIDRKYTQVQTVIGTVLARELGFAGYDDMMQRMPVGKFDALGIIHLLEQNDARLQEFLQNTSTFSLVHRFLQNAFQVQGRLQGDYMRFLQLKTNGPGVTGGMDHFLNKWRGTVYGMRHRVSADGREYFLTPPIKPGVHNFTKDLTDDATIPRVSAPISPTIKPYVNEGRELNRWQLASSPEVAVVTSPKAAAAIELHDAEHAFMGIMFGPSVDNTRKVARALHQAESRSPRARTLRELTSHARGTFGNTVVNGLTKEWRRAPDVSGAYVQVLTPGDSQSGYRAIGGQLKGNIRGFVCLPDRTVVPLGITQPDEGSKPPRYGNITGFLQEVPVGSTVLFAPSELYGSTVAEAIQKADSVQAAVNSLSEIIGGPKVVAMYIRPQIA